MADHEYKAPETEIAAIIGLVETYNQWKNANQGARGFERYHPSAFGKCLRLMQYERYVERGYVKIDTPLAEPFMVRIWDTGHSMHDRWRSYFESLGVLRGYWQCNNPFCLGFDDSGHFNNELLVTFQLGELSYKTRFYGKDQLQGCFRPEKCVCGSTRFHYHEIDVKSEELNFFGHCDLILDFSKFDPNILNGVEPRYLPEYLPKKPVVVDMKTINMFDFQDLDKSGADPAYEIQLTIYANILDCEYGVLIYENKNNAKTKAFKVERNTNTVWTEIRKQALAMNEMIEVSDDEGNVHHLLPPPRPSFLDDAECSRCKFASICHASSIWNDSNLDQKRKEFYGTLLK
jgi:hypothetical protein